MMKNILIVGMGEIGKSIKGLYDYIEEFRLFEKDTNPILPIEKLEIMHVCYPYSNKFVKETVEYVKYFKPRLVIIHSSIPYLTTRVIQDNVDVGIVHSPCMGKHPNLTESFRTFRKIIASYDKKALSKAKRHFTKIYVDTVSYKNPEHSELSKLLSTSYYAWNICFMQDVHDLCKKHNLDFEEVYEYTNTIYNEGYHLLSEHQFIRPVLKYMGKGIGGHCLVGNAKILKQSKMLKDITKKILKHSK